VVRGSRRWRGDLDRVAFQASELRPPAHHPHQVGCQGQQTGTRTAKTRTTRQSRRSDRPLPSACGPRSWPIPAPSPTSSSPSTTTSAPQAAGADQRATGFCSPAFNPVRLAHSGIQLCVRVTSAMFWTRSAMPIASQRTPRGHRYGPRQVRQVAHVRAHRDRSHVLFRYTETFQRRRFPDARRLQRVRTRGRIQGLRHTLPRPRDDRGSLLVPSAPLLLAKLECDPDRALEAWRSSASCSSRARVQGLTATEKTYTRAARAGPILELFDEWGAPPGAGRSRGPLDAAITYYDNQRDALRRFLDDEV